MKISLFNRDPNPRHFVALAVELTDCTPSHAGILIRLNGKHYFHHFPGGTPPEIVENYANDGRTVYSILEWIVSNDESEIAAILAICRNICNKSNISYSYTIDGSKYNQLGEFISKNGLPELGTCVGFCIYTLNQFLIDAENCVIPEEWDGLDCNISIDRRSRENLKKEYPNMDWEIYERFHKRILPIEYLAINSSSKYPITRAQINRTLPGLNERIRRVANCAP